jgi:hypothetical protein
MQKKELVMLQCSIHMILYTNAELIRFLQSKFNFWLFTFLTRIPIASNLLKRNGQALHGGTPKKTVQAVAGDSVRKRTLT